MGAEFTHILDSLGWAVLHSIWQGGVAFLFVVIWRAALRGSSPALRHAGQVTALIACMAAFVWTFASYLGGPTLVVEGGATFSAANAAETPRLLTGLIAPFDPAAAQAGLGLSRITPILACFWALGFAAMSLRYAFAFGQVQQLRTIGLRQPDSLWTERFTRLAQDIGVSAKVRLYLSTNVAGPMTLGLIKPVVLVPVGFLTSLPADQVEAILRHELAHIRRYDYALNLIQTGVKTVLFYHPAIHIICRWADQDREQACDDLAVKQGRDPLILARGLAALRLGTNPAFTLAATGSGKDMPLMNRLTRLAGQTPKRGRPEHILMSFLSALLLGSVYLGASSRAEAHPHPAPPSVPDTIINIDRERPVAPVAPVPPVLRGMDISDLNSRDKIQRLMTSDKAAYRRFEKDMERYASELETFFEESDLSQREHENFSGFYEDLAADMSDMFEDRRELIEKLHEAQIEQRQDIQEIESELHAEQISLESALKGIKDAERQLRNYPDSDEKKAKLKALKQARKDIMKAQRNMRTARSQSKTAESVAHAKANRARQSEVFAAQKVNHARAKTLNAKARMNVSKARAHTEINRPSQKAHKAFRDKVMSELLKDGLIKSATESVYLTHPKGKMSLNGEPMPKAFSGKYCELWDEFGFADDQSEITITPDSLTILTDWKNGRHTTKVTYGTFDTEKTSH